MAERGHSLVPILDCHLEYFAAVHGAERIERERVAGYSLVDRNYLPLACSGVLFEPDKTILFGHFGRWFGEYPVPILRAMRGTANRLRELGVTELHTICERGIPKARQLIEWAGGIPTGEETDFGPAYVIPLINGKV